MALRARRRWEEVGGRRPGHRVPGQRLADRRRHRRAERAVMEAFADHPDAAARAIAFLEPDEVRALQPRRAGRRRRGRCTARSTRWSSPACALGALRDHLGAHAPARYRFHPGRRVVAAEPRRARRHRRAPAGRAISSSWRPAPPTTTCPARDGLAARLRRVRLQMLETAPFAASAHDLAGRRRHPALLPGLRGGAAVRARPAGPGGGRAPPPAAPGAAARRRADHRRHPRLRRAVRLRAQRGPHRGAAGPGRPHPRRAAPAGAAALGGRVRPVHRRRGVPARGDRARRLAGHRSRRAGHDLCAGHRRGHARGGRGGPA